jgi:hypothetical protein
MTRSQFAMAVLADEKWVENTARLLKRQLRYTPAEARWLALVRQLHQDLGLTLSRSAELADEAFRYAPDDRSVILGETEGGSVGIALDMGRFQSTFAASLSAALEFGGARRRGRPRASVKRKRDALDKASQYGVDLDLVRQGLELSVQERLERADANAAFINALRPVNRQ